MSQIATTKEQGRRLITAGVGTESADMVYGFVVFGDIRKVTLLPKDENIEKDSIIFFAWSLSALWSIIYNLDKTYEFQTELSAEELIETLVTTICYRYELR